MHLKFPFTNFLKFLFSNKSSFFPDTKRCYLSTSCHQCRFMKMFFAAKDNKACKERVKSGFIIKMFENIQ